MSRAGPIKVLFNITPTWIKRIVWLLIKVASRRVPISSASLSSNFSGIGRCGEDCRIKNSNLSGEIVIGNSVQIYDALITGSVRIGDFTTVNGPNTIIRSEFGTLRIGKFCSLAPNVFLVDSNHNYKKLTTYFIFKNLISKYESKFVESSKDLDVLPAREIIIDNDVWIGAHSVILPGVRIHDGAVIAANSTVTKDVPPYAIVAGSPARVIGFRFESNIIDELIKMRWWDWDVSRIMRSKHLFNGEFEISRLRDFEGYCNRPN